MDKTIYSEDYRLIINKLKKARKESNITQRHVAKKLNKPQSYISKIETCERRVDVLELTILAKIYKKPLSYFVK